MQKGITKLKNILEGDSDEHFNSYQYIMLYTTIYNMCTQKPPRDYSQQLYDRYRESFQDYINTKVLPALREKHDECMLNELVKRWDNHKVMVRWLSRFFNYLDRYFTPMRSLPALNEVGLICFREQVYTEMKNNVKDAVLTLAEECLKREKERVGHYLHANSEQKLLERVQQELLSQYEQQLLEKKHSGCHALLRNDKVDDLSRMYGLFCRLPKDLEPIAAIFRMHVTEEGTALVKQAEDAASNKKAEKKDTVGVQEQTFVWKVIELHDKYLQYVSECFINHSLFHKALKEAFEVFCNKGVAGNTSVELLATFCHNLLKKGGYEKLIDEAIEDTLQKVVRLLAYISDKDLFAEFYRKKQARRLLFDKSANDDHERSILTKLKTIVWS